MVIDGQLDWMSLLEVSSLVILWFWWISRVPKEQFGTLFGDFAPSLTQSPGPVEQDGVMCGRPCILSCCSRFKRLEQWSPSKGYLELTEFWVLVLIIHNKMYARFLLVNVPDTHRLLLFAHRIASEASRLCAGWWLAHGSCHSLCSRGWEVR